MGASSSTLGLTQFTESETALLASLASAEPWPLDDPRWLDLFGLKHRLTDLDAAALRAALDGVAAAAAGPGLASRNVATLAAHVAARLAQSWHFVRGRDQRGARGLAPPARPPARARARSRARRAPSPTDPLALRCPAPPRAAPRRPTPPRRASRSSS